MAQKHTKARYRAARAKEQNGKCFFCFLRMGEDCTLEHFQAKHLGGTENYSNMRAAHAKCNSLVGHWSVEVKTHLHETGRDHGSDEFFREVTRLKKVELKDRKKKRKEMKRAMLENALDMYRARDSYAEAYDLLPANLQRQFFPPVEKTELQKASARSRAAVVKMLEKATAAQ